MGLCKIRKFLTTKKIVICDYPNHHLTLKAELTRLALYARVQIVKTLVRLEHDPVVEALAAVVEFNRPVTVSTRTIVL
jgi:hypothetical protein